MGQMTTDEVNVGLFDELKKAQQEIEDLRQQLSDMKQVVHISVQEKDEWKRRAAAEKLANTILVKASEEWERRFSMLRNEVREVEINYFLANHPEAAEWFEAEGFQSSIEEKDEREHDWVSADYT